MNITENNIWLDHIGVVGDDLGYLETVYGQIGFHVAPRCEMVAISPDGTIAPLNQINSHLVFANSYVELTSVTGATAGHHLENAIARYFGLHIVVLATDDIGQVWTRLHHDGIASNPVAKAGRHINYPGGNGMGKFSWFRVDEEAAPDAYFCQMQHHTFDLVYDSALNIHPNGARELEEIFICVKDPNESARRIAGIFCGEVKTEQDSVSVLLKQGVIRFVDQESLVARYPGVDVPPLPFAAGFTLSVEDMAASKSYFDSRNIEFHESGSTFWISPITANGPIIEFTSAR